MDRFVSLRRSSRTTPRSPSPHRAPTAVLGVLGLSIAFAAPVGAQTESPAPSGPALSRSASASPSAQPTPLLAMVADTSSGRLASSGGTWSLDVPRLEGPLDPAFLASINEALAEQAAKDLAAFEAGSQPPTDPAMGVDDFAQDFSVALLTPDLLSLRVLTYQYASGGAHGGAVLTPWTFDLHTGERLELADLFLPGADYLKTLASVARQQLLPDYGTDRPMRRWVRDGTRPTPQQYSGWALTPDGLEITFGQYQVAPYAAGMPVVVVPWAALAGLLDPASPAATLWQEAAAAEGLEADRASPSASPFG